MKTVSTVLLISLLSGISTLPFARNASAQTAPLVNVCSGLSVDLPILEPVATTVVDPLLSVLAGIIDTDIVGVLSGQTIGVSVLDTDGNVVSTTDCGLTANNVTVDNNSGVSIGGGQINGLGSTANAAASAAEANSLAIGNGATTTASAANALAFGLRSTVSATDGIAIGRDAIVAGEAGIALGAGASAGYNNSVAIGAGATALREGQVVLGTSSNTYTMAGIGSSASRAAQTGPVKLVTSDANGNLATTDFDIASLTGDISRLKTTVDRNRKDANKGIAAAMAMTGAPTPSAPGKTAWATNVATYGGEFATSFAVAHMLDVEYPVVLNGSLGYAPGGSVGVQLGVNGEF
ncbi:hypothetical protein [Agrobacterium sp.]|jgi:autotransporter adhesin|uniref:hypothetical protein n=1 Tax=Agrobacterium sp. TaxID=361 RepID=UPI0028AAD6BF|nr:hypothetical protein [Agrobacterium sp.]